MGAIASQITSLTIVYSTVYLRCWSKKTSISASLAFERGIHRGPVNSPHKRPVTRKMLPFDDVIMHHHCLIVSTVFDCLYHCLIISHRACVVIGVQVKGQWYFHYESMEYRWQNGLHVLNKQRVLMHRHQGWNVRHGLCHIYMRYLYIYELFIAFVCFVVCSLL